MPSYNKCYYSGCNNTKKSRPDLVFHRFPSDKEKLLMWIQCSGHKIADEDDVQWNHRLICSSHFNPQDYMPGCRPILSKNAVPKDFNTSVINSQPNNNTNSHNINTNNVNNTISSRLNVDIHCDNNECQNSSDRYKKSNIDIIREAVIMKALNRSRLVIKRLRKRNIALRQKITYWRKSSQKWNYLRLISLANTVIKNEKSLFIIEMQISHLKTKSWSNDEKNFALSIYLRSSKCYKFLRDEYNMTLPSITLIHQWLNEQKKS